MPKWTVKLQTLLPGLAAVVGLASPLPSSAVALSAELRQVLRLEGSFDIEAGLNAQTRELLLSLPAEARRQAILALREALPLIDQSVEMYLAKAEAIVARQISSIDCSLAGAAKRSVAELSDAVKFWKSGPTIFEDATRRADELPKRFSWSTTPAQYRVYYADVLSDVYAVSCAMRGIPSVKWDIEALSTRLELAKAPWDRLRGLECADPGTCTLRVKEIVRQEAAGADVRDRVAARVDERLDSIAQPEKPSFFGKRFDADAYAYSIRSALAVGDEVRILSEVRNAEAKLLRDQAETEIIAMVDRIRTLQARVSRVALGDLRDMRAPLSEEASTKATKIRALLTRLSDLMPSMSVHAQAIEARILSALQEERNAQSAINTRVSEVEKQMRDECNDACGGSANEFCPRKRLEKPSQCGH